MTTSLKFTSVADYHAARIEFVERNATIAHLLLVPAEYQTIFGHAPAAIIVDPGQPPVAAVTGDSAEDRQLATASFDRWKVMDARHKEQVLQLKTAKVDLLDIMPVDVKESLKRVVGTISLGLLNKSAAQLLADVDALYLVITTETLSRVKSELARSCSADLTSIRTVSSEHRKAHQVFAMAGQPMTDHDQVVLFSETLPNAFSLFLKFFNMKYPLPADKKFETLVKEALVEAENLSTVANNVAHLAAAIPIVSSPISHANVVKAAHKSTTFSYCWSHGLVTNPSHSSPTCTNRHPLHDATSTMANYKTKGGKLSIWKRGDKLGP